MNRWENTLFLYIDTYAHTQTHTDTYIYMMNMWIEIERSPVVNPFQDCSLVVGSI